jgi:hypothetical protein
MKRGLCKILQDRRIRRGKAFLFGLYALAIKIFNRKVREERPEGLRDSTVRGRD